MRTTLTIIFASSVLASVLLTGFSEVSVNQEVNVNINDPRYRDQVYPSGSGYPLNYEQTQTQPIRNQGCTFRNCQNFCQSRRFYSGRCISGTVCRCTFQ